MVVADRKGNVVAFNKDGQEVSSSCSLLLLDSKKRKKSHLFHFQGLGEQGDGLPPRDHASGRH